MKRSALLGLCMLAVSLFATAQVRKEIAIPNIDGYMTLKCDFHLHTVFSDGYVWPTVRVDEAYREGLDAIAITEHIEYLPHKDDINADHNRSYEICAKYAEKQGGNILVIHGSEITRPMAPGHFNALFLENSNALDKKDWRDAFKEAKRQHAFIFWNHPGWERQQPDTTLWFSEHTELLEQGCMHGIEVVNGSLFMPEAMAWCKMNNLTMLGTSDIHQPIQTAYDESKDEHRPMTLVFAKERSLEGIREALECHRTVVYYKDNLIGKEEYLKQLFEKSFSVENVAVKDKKNRIMVTVYNSSDVPFVLKKHEHPDDVNFFRNVTIKPHCRHTLILTITEGKEIEHGTIAFEVTNLWVAPGKGLIESISF